MHYLYLIIPLSICVVLKVIQKLTIGRCKSPVCLIGKTALVTGGNSGIGFETALGLAARGCRVIIADKDDCDESKANIIAKTRNTNIITKKFDLASLSSVRELAKDLNATEDRLDILINNAGAAGLGNKYTKDGLHIGMQVNHFGSFLLTHLLVDLLKKSAPSRIIFVSSVLAYLGAFTLTKRNINLPGVFPNSIFTEFSMYINSKFCNIVTANVFAKKLAGTGVTSNSLHPGIVYTLIYEKLYVSNGAWLSRVLCCFLFLLITYTIMPFAKNAEEGAQTTLHLALDEHVKNQTGKFFGDCIRFKMPRRARYTEHIDGIWRASEDLVKVSPDEKI